MKEKILEILYKHSEEVDIKGSIMTEPEREDWMWSGIYEKVADDLINKLGLGDVRVRFKGQRLDNEEWIEGWFTKKQIGSLFCPVIERLREWDSGDYIETVEIDGATLTNAL